MIPECVRRNFVTLQKAFKNKDACLVQSTRVSDGQTVYLICAVSPDQEGVDLVPFAEMCSTNPYEAYHHPTYAMEKEENVTDIETTDI